MPTTIPTDAATSAVDAAMVRPRDSSFRLIWPMSLEASVTDSPFQFAMELSPRRRTLSSVSVNDDPVALVMLPSTTATLGPIFGARLIMPRGESSTDTGVAGASSA
jgi:hypothetical protein